MFRFTDLIIFRMTRDCNLNCTYCFMQNKADFKGERIDFTLYKKIINRIIEQRLINNLEKRTLQLVFHGGEFLLVGKKRLYELLEYATLAFQNAGLQFVFGCQTNATLLTDEICKILGKFEVHVGLSFDGVGAANSARTDLKQDIFERKFEMLEKNAVKYGFIIVASKQNVGSIDESKEYLETLGIDEKTSIVSGYKINYAEDMLNPGENSEVELTGQEMFDKVWKPELERFLVRKQTMEYHTRELLEKSMIDLLTHHSNSTKSGCGTKWCGAGLGMIGIEPDGEMDYCDRYSKKFPEAYVMHALDYDFLGIYQLKKAIEYNTMKSTIYKKYECDTCFADYICDHGCESFYKSKYGDYGIDTRIICDQHKEFYSFVLQHLEKFVEVYVDSNKTLNTFDHIYSLKRLAIDRLEKAGISIAVNTDNNQVVMTRKVI